LFIQSKLFVNDRIRVCIACDDGRDLSVGIALAALMPLFDGQGRPSAEGASVTRKVLLFFCFIVTDGHGPFTSEAMARSGLEWIISSRRQANASPATLKCVNEFFLSPSSFRSSGTARSHSSPQT
jgi:tRNA A64-2'-O-ribosylphosphate transferase